MTIEEIQRRCRAAAERFEALAGPEKVDTVVSADLLLEAASLLRGYHQCLLLELLPNPAVEPTRDQIQELERLAARMSRDSRWQVTEAAFRLGLRLCR